MPFHLLDVHQGDGTASIFKKNNNVFTFSMHCNSNFPLKKMNSNIDIPLDSGIGDSKYLEILTNQLKKLDDIKSDIIFFQAGVDTLYKDRLGKLSLTRRGLKIRNEKILNFAKKKNLPMVVFMGGGYSDPIEHSVNAFTDLFLQCSNFI